MSDIVHVGTTVMDSDGMFYMWLEKCEPYGAAVWLYIAYHHFTAQGQPLIVSHSIPITLDEMKATIEMLQAGVSHMEEKLARQAKEGMQ